ncbi:MAG TPA: DUF3048 domain-containing protein [Streptosporangiaceae bacterium]|nr:DUF3048 domain-containing protein [Streptosporangiaceae bacterium]
MMWTRRKTVAAASAAVAVAAVTTSLILISGGGQGPPARPAHSSSPARLMSPFTGEPVTALRRILAVKIDNIAQARPQTGLTSADIVYVLPVEGGLSRFLAIFSSRLPPVIGPVRSAREDDLELLAQFGRPAFAFSGAQPQLLPVVERARIVNLYSGVTSGYFRGTSRVAPYNLYARTSQLLAQAKGASLAHSIGFRFGPAPAGGRPAAPASVSYRAASFTFTWSAARSRWLVSMDGARAASTEDGQLSAATVVIQHTIVRTSRFLEYGARPPYAESTGSGPAIVLRDGRTYQARWSRPAADGGTTFTTASGQPMTFAAGPVWIVLAAG